MSVAPPCGRYTSDGLVTKRNILISQLHMTNAGCGWRRPCCHPPPAQRMAAPHPFGIARTPVRNHWGVTLRRPPKRETWYSWLSTPKRPCGLMDKALVFGTKDCRFESCQGHYYWCHSFRQATPFLHCIFPPEHPRERWKYVSATGTLLSSR